MMSPSLPRTKFHYPVWNKILFSLFFVLLMILPGYLLILSSRFGQLGLGVVIFIAFLLVLDSYNMKLFSEIEVLPEGIRCQRGGFLWQFFPTEKIFRWDEYRFMVSLYFYGREKVSQEQSIVEEGGAEYYAFQVMGRNNNVNLFVESDLVNFNQMVEQVKRYNPNLELIESDRIRDEIKLRQGTISIGIEIYGVILIMAALAYYLHSVFAWHKLFDHLIPTVLIVACAIGLFEGVEAARKLILIAGGIGLGIAMLLLILAIQGIGNVSMVFALTCLGFSFISIIFFNLPDIKSFFKL